MPAGDAAPLRGPATVLLTLTATSSPEKTAWLRTAVLPLSIAGRLLPIIKGVGIAMNFTVSSIAAMVHCR